MSKPKKSFQFQNADSRLDSLRRTKINPRKLSDDKRALLKQAIFEFGDLGGIVRNRRTQELIGGNQRVEDFRSDPDAKVVIEHELPKPDRVGTVAYGYVEAHGTRFAYREVDWDKDRAAAANLAANKHGGEFDLPIVAEMLKELANSSSLSDLNVTGFSVEDIAEFATGASSEGTVKTVKPAAPPARVWFLLGIDTVQMDKLQPIIDQIAGIKTVYLESTVTNADKKD